MKLKGTDERLRPGMTARVSIISDHVKDVLRIPVAALFQDDKRRYCYVRVAGKLEVLPVKVGRSNEDWIEILEGLAVGQQVSLLRP